MSITGAADADGGRPTKVGVAIADVATGLHAAVGILAALAGRERAGSPAHGVGQRIDVSIFESTLSMLVNQAQNAFVDGVAPGRLGNAHPNIVPYETFETADGEIAVAVGSERQWPRFCLAIGLPALADDPRFATNGDRVTNRAELLATSASGSRSGRPRSGSRRSTRPTSRPGRSTTSRRRSPPSRPSPGAWRSRSTTRPSGRTTQVGLPFELSATPAEIRTAAAAARRARRRDPRRGRATPARRSPRSAPAG